MQVAGGRTAAFLENARWLCCCELMARPVTAQLTVLLRWLVCRMCLALFAGAQEPDWAEAE